MWCCLRFLGTTMHLTGTGGIVGKKTRYKVLTARGGVIRRFVQVELVTGNVMCGRVGSGAFEFNQRP